MIVNNIYKPLQSGKIHFMPSHFAKPYRRLFSCYRILQNHIEDSFHAIAFCKTISKTLFMPSHFTKPYRRFFLCYRILQNHTEDSFHAIAFCKTIPKTLFMPSHFAKPYQQKQNPIPKPTISRWM